MSQVPDAVSTILSSAVDAQRVAVRIHMTPLVQRVAARYLAERQGVSASSEDEEYIKDLERAIDSAHKMLDVLEKDKGKIDEDAFKSFRKGVEENIARYTKKIDALRDKATQRVAARHKILIGK